MVRPLTATHKKEETLSARTQLNAVYTLGSLILAVIVGLLCQSLAVFFVVVVLLLTVCLANGTIRPTGRNR